MYPDEQACKLIDELMRKGTTRTTELSDILERDYGITIEPHFVSEYKYRKRHNLEIREDFSGFEKGEPEGTKTAP